MTAPHRNGRPESCLECAPHVRCERHKVWTCPGCGLRNCHPQCPRWNGGPDEPIPLLPDQPIPLRPTPTHSKRMPHDKNVIHAHEAGILLARATLRKELESVCERWLGLRERGGGARWEVLETERAIEEIVGKLRDIR